MGAGLVPLQGADRRVVDADGADHTHTIIIGDTGTESDRLAQPAGAAPATLGGWVRRRGR
jgi:hypothetical protein